MNNNNEPVVLGTLKKDKSSKPIFVLFIFILLLGTCFGLPYIKDYINNNNNVFTRWYKTTFGEITDDDGTNSEAKNDSSLTTLSKGSSVTYQYFVINNFTVEEDSLSYSITTTKNMNLDNENIYLEIYSSSSQVIGRIKLTGDFIKGIKTENTSKFTAFKLNTNTTYYIKIRALKVESYPDVTISNDTLTCKNDTLTYVYSFKNTALIKIDETYDYKKSDLTAYMNELNKANARTNLIITHKNSTSSVTENNTGFTFLATIDLSDFKRNDLKTYIDYNIYDLNTTAKQVNYEMETKGFTCL